MTSGISLLSEGEEVAGPPEGPTTQRERLPMLDVLRGVALLGILLVNIDDFFAPEVLKDIPFGLPLPAFVGWHAQLDHSIAAFKWLFIEAKMRGLFAMLFGAGVVLLTSRLETGSRSAQTADIYCRRNLWLVAFGLIHGIFIWTGDILATYGLIALVLLFPLRRLSARQLLGVGTATWLVLATLGNLNVWGAPAAIHKASLLTAAQTAKAQGRPLTADQKALIRADRDQPADIKSEVSEIVAQSHRPYFRGFTDNAKGYLDNVARCFTSGFTFEIIGAMMVGMGLFKLGFLTGRSSTRIYLVTAVIGYAISSSLVLVGLAHLYESHFKHVTYLLWLQGPYCVAGMAATLANTSVLILLARTRIGSRLLWPFGAVGRTAFSNYILTSILCQILFSGSGMGLYGRLEYYQSILIVLGVWTINIVASNLWLKYFAFGPLEWAWRSLTYWKRQPLRFQPDGMEAGRTPASIRLVSS